MYYMKKIIKKQGNSLCIIINRQDREIYDLGEGDKIELTITKIENGKKKKVR